MPLPDAEANALLDNIVETQIAQIEAIKAASDERNAALEELAVQKKRASELEARVAELSKSTVKSAASIIAPLSAGIADALCQRGILDEENKEEWRAQIGDDPAMLKVAFDQLAARVPVIPPSRGSSIKDPTIKFSGSKSAATGEVSWFEPRAA